MGIAILPEWQKSAKMRQFTQNDPRIFELMSIPQNAMFHFTPPDHWTGEPTKHEGTHLPKTTIEYWTILIRRLKHEYTLAPHQVVDAIKTATPLYTLPKAAPAHPKKRHTHTHTELQHNSRTQKLQWQHGVPSTL
jgi:hypothetical protein